MNTSRSRDRRKERLVEKLGHTPEDADAIMRLRTPSNGKPKRLPGVYTGLSWSHLKPGKPGIKPDPNRDKSEVVVTARLKKREWCELEKHRRLNGKNLTESIFLRFVICQFLEQHRRKDCPTMSFNFDLEKVDWRSKKKAGTQSAKAANHATGETK